MPNLAAHQHPLIRSHGLQFIDLIQGIRGKYCYSFWMILKTIAVIHLCLFILLPASASTNDGRTLYNNNCAICHGNDGHGGVGIPLALPSFLEQVSDQYLHRTIRIGRPGRVMPSFYKLSNEEIDAIIAYIRSWHKQPAPSWDDTPIKGNADNGRTLFASHCASCHGDQARGGKGTGVMFSRPKELPITAPALNNQGFLNSASDQMIKHTIMNGRKETPMPSGSALGLSEQQVDDIISYLRSFEQSKILLKPAVVDDEPPSLIYESPYNFDETVENVKRSIAGMNFVHIRDQAIDSGFVAEGKESKKQMMVYFCNFNFLYQALSIDPRVGLFLPCRITIVEQDGKVQVMSINPKHLSHLFNNNELDDACDEMHGVYTSILEDATL